MDEFTSALDTAAAIRSKAVSPLEVLDATLARIDRLNPELNAVIWRNDTVALAEAEALGERIAAGADDLPPFAGVPIPIKDLTAVEGQPLTYGSLGAPAGMCDHSDLVVDAFRRAGFILTGRTNAPEFGSITVTENLRYGPTRNPWNPDHTSGGSSGGAATAVSSGMFSVAHASDGGGSIRIPSSCCGLVGLKPSRGRVPSLIPAWQGLTTDGALCLTVADAAALLDVMSQPDRGAWWNAPAPAAPFATEPGKDPGRLRVAMNTVSALGLPVSDEAVAAVEATGKLLEQAGHQVERLDTDVFSAESLAPFLFVVSAGLADNPGIDWEKVEPNNRAGYLAAQGVNSFTFTEAVDELHRLSRQIVGRWGAEFDLLVTPTMAIEPPPVGVLAAVHESPEMPPLEVMSMAAFTAAFNITGQPAVSLPLHTAASGLPVGVQLVAGPWEDGLLLRVAAQLEAAAPWAGRHPATG
ncbi:MAG TPA: amidase [Acidimicrobiales bacterium]|jgi:amidase|nr:amidase [Acidimicrobiales bacterium]